MLLIFLQINFEYIACIYFLVHENFKIQANCKRQGLVSIFFCFHSWAMQLAWQMEPQKHIYAVCQMNGQVDFVYEKLCWYPWIQKAVYRLVYRISIINYKKTRAFRPLTPLQITPRSTMVNFMAFLVHGANLIGITLTVIYNPNEKVL